MKPIRLDSYLASAGIGARRQIKDILFKNELILNGKKITQPGVRIDPKRDKISYNGQPIIHDELVYFIVNKPRGVVSTASDELQRKTAVSLVKTDKRVYPVGRLDQDSSGLILMTNDGELTNALTHPRFHIPKTYQLIITGGIPQNKIERLQKGIQLRDGMTGKADVKIIKHMGDKTYVEMTIYEGKNRQIRRMCAAVGLNLEDLKRLRIGTIELADLKLGGFRKLTKKEISSLKSNQIH